MAHDRRQSVVRSRARRGGPQPWRLREAQVAAENRAAAGMAATDSRWVFAVAVSQTLEGGRAGILSPEKRRRLVVSAQEIGLRPFDANLIIAIVQDSVRTGEPPLSTSVEDRVMLVRPADEPAPPWKMILGLACGAAASMGLFLLLIGWVMG